MVFHIRSTSYVSLIIYLSFNLVATDSDEVVQCEWSGMDNRNLMFHCRGSVEENNRKELYFCCEDYIYCYRSSWQYKSSFRSIEFVSGCRFPRLELNIFKSYKYIQHLTLSNVGLEMLRLQDFTYAEHLELFDASHNELTEIPTMVFANAPQLIDVNFSFNQINRIHSMAFEQSSVDHFNQITRLDLSNNRIDVVDNATFAALISLETLYLSSNFIRVIAADVFTQNMKLTTLQLSYNNLSSFACDNLNNVWQLDLGYNNIMSIDGHFSSIGEISLNVENNKLTNITLNSNYTSLQAFSNELQWIIVESDLFELQTLNVSHNRVENIPEILSRFGDALKFLDLTNNFVGKLTVNMFKKCNNLVELRLRNTSLTNIQYGTFHHQQKLRLLDISFNNLKKINFNTFRQDLHSLVYFYLDGNNLTQMDGFAPLYFPNLNRIGITANNFTCNYLSEYMWQWRHLSHIEFVSDSISLSDRSHVGKILCTESTDDHYPHLSTSVDHVTEENVHTQSTWTMNEAKTKVVEYRHSESTDRNLLIFVLVVLCIICVNLVTKNLIGIWSARKRSRRFGDEANVRYFKEVHEDFDRRSDGSI